MAREIRHDQVGENTHRSNNSIKNQVGFPDYNISLPPIFNRYVVLDVIDDQTFFTLENLLKLEELHGTLQNRFHATNLVVPRNSIIAKPVYSSDKQNRFDANQPVIVYPFFPSHLALPCKPGEHVWVMFESVTDVMSLGYWFCRVVGPDHIDDVNHSHAPREHDSSFTTPIADPALLKEFGLEPDEAKPRYHFKNGIFIGIDTDSSGQKQAMINPHTFTLLSQDKSNAYESLLSGSFASKRVIREPVPRYKKYPAELALEGSNNTLVSLGVDRNMPESSAGAIDIVAGRGTKPETMGNIAENEIGFIGTEAAIKGKELDKHYEKLISTEGNSDYTNDRSRILISQKTKPDASFGLVSYNSNFNSFNAGTTQPTIEDSAQGDAAIVIKTDKVRIIARSDIQLIVQGWTSDTNVMGETIKTQVADSTKWASITIKRNGDIVFSPSSEGYIKLGGDDADKGIVCSAVPVAKQNGGVVGNAIQNTAGGRFGGSLTATSIGNTPAIGPNHGTFANKVLVK